MISRRRCAVRHAGALSSENAGMSNHKESENLSHRKSKVSWAMMINPGLVGPKPRRSSVGDGQRVNIPVPVYVCFWVRIEYVGAGSWLYPSKSLLWRRMKGLQRPIPTDTVTRKAHKRVAYADRTANRHRYSGREDQGEREILRQGTRQFSDRNFGIRSASRRFSLYLLSNMFATYANIRHYLWITSVNAYYFDEYR